jgi:glutaredoxin 3
MFLRLLSILTENRINEDKMSSFLTKSILCFAMMQTLVADVVLYSSHRCPYCKKVDAYLDSVHKTVQTKIIDDNPTLRNELKEKGGKVQVPCLIIDDYPLYGSQEIIQWMKTHPERLEDRS